MSCVSASGRKGGARRAGLAGCSGVWSLRGGLSLVFLCCATITTELKSCVDMIAPVD